MAEARVDEGVENLERFSTLLAETTANLGARASLLEEHGAGLEKLDDEARARMGRVNDRLEAALDRLDDRQQEAVEETEDLAGAAEKLTPDVLGDAAARLHVAEDGCARRLDSARSRLETEMLDLSRSGFAALADALDQIEAGLRRAGEGAGDGLQALEETLAELEVRAGGVRADGVRVLDAVQQELGREQQTLEASAAEALTRWADASNEIEEDGAAVADAVEALYGAWRDELLSEAQRMMDAVAELMQQGAAFVLEDTGRPLGQQVEGVAEGALQPLAGDVERLCPILAEGEQQADTASSLVEDLLVVRQVIAEVDRLLAALKE
jgi:hypothetical protein